MPLIYQWRKAGASLPGQTNSALTLLNSAVSDTGDYDVVVASAYGCVTSSIASLTVLLLPPEITLQPADLPIVSGGNPTLSVTVSGSVPMFCQWQLNGTNLSFATNASLTISNAQSANAGSYRLMLTNSYGSVTSAVAVLTVLPTNAALSRYTFITLAGSATAGTTDGYGETARFSSLAGTALDSAGNVFMADSGSHTLRQFRPAGTNWIVSTTAGTPQRTGTADGPGNAALFSSPHSVASDSAGNLYVADMANFTIRQLQRSTTNWVVTTIAGREGYSGSQDGGGANALFNKPSAAKLDASGNIYVADFQNHVIRMASRVETNWLLTTIAGSALNSGAADGVNSAARFNLPTDVAVDGEGNVYVADWGNSRVRKITPIGTNWVVTTLATGFTPVSLALDANTNIFTADQEGTIHCLSRIGNSWTATTLGGIAGNYGLVDGAGDAARFLKQPGGIALDTAGNLYIANATAARLGFPSDPLVITQPQSQTNSLGAAVAFTVQASSPVALGYQWRCNGTNVSNTARMSGAQSSTLTISQLAPGDSGSYEVIITTPYGGLSRAVVTLAIIGQPSIVRQPQNLNVCWGEPASFSVAANGADPLSYQWFVAGTAATAQPLTINGFVLAAEMTSGGTGYLTVPAVHFIDGSGNGAGGYAVIHDGKVTAITITNAGYGYTTPPTIQIDPPPVTSLPAQTNAVMLLPAVTGEQAANYFVIVTNLSGLVTSTAAELNIIPPPEGFSATIGTNGQLHLQFSGAPGRLYSLQSTTNLTTPAAWEPVVTQPADAGGAWHCVETNLLAPQRFYRVVTP